MFQKIERVNHNVFCIYNPSYYNCSYIIKRKDKIVLIDTGMKSNGSDVKKAFQKLGFKLSDITAVLLTHWHNDHAAGTSEVKRLTNCKTYAHLLEKPYFEQEQSNPIRRLADYIPERGLLVLFKGLIGDTVPKKVEIDHLVKNGDLILSDFEVIETPGHTEGHVSYYDRKTKTLFTGDSLAVVKNKLRLMAGPVTPDKPTSIQSILNSINNRDIEFICPGHRTPLTENVKSEIERFSNYVQNLEKWPLLG